MTSGSCSASPPRPRLRGIAAATVATPVKMTVITATVPARHGLRVALRPGPLGVGRRVLDAAEIGQPAPGAS